MACTAPALLPPAMRSLRVWVMMYGRGAPLMTATSRAYMDLPWDWSWGLRPRGGCDTALVQSCRGPLCCALLPLQGRARAPG